MTEYATPGYYPELLYNIYVNQIVTNGISINSRLFYSPDRVKIQIVTNYLKFGMIMHFRMRIR